LDIDELEGFWMDSGHGDDMEITRMEISVEYPDEMGDGVFLGCFNVAPPFSLAVVWLQV
jgi:hypothetical protein